MLGTTLRDGERATWIGEQARADDVVAEVKKKRTWTGHVVRRTDNRWTIRVTEEGEGHLHSGIMKFGGRLWAKRPSTCSGPNYAVDAHDEDAVLMKTPISSLCLEVNRPQ